jgi:tetraacyldisaccharide 4'-kinase
MPASSPSGLPAALTAPLAAAYAAGGRWVSRRQTRWARRLRRPVISVGGLAVGGSGKTPLAAYVAAVLRDAGERPAILSRGYARDRAEDGVVVVGDGTSLRADLARSGDEPLLLARSLPGVAVLVCEDRFLAGCFAESRLGCTVHVLDDGFQHHRLERDADLVIVSAEDAGRGRVLPAGRLREPLVALRRAEAVVVPHGDEAEVSAVVAAVNGAGTPTFTMSRGLGVPRLVEPWGAPPRVPRSSPVMALAGIARPEAFFAALQAQEWNVVATRAFGDHHHYTRDEVDAVAREASTAGAALILTTEKDLMRLLPLRPLGAPVAWVPMRVDVEPAGAFREWILGRVAAALTARPVPASERVALPPPVAVAPDSP